MSGPALLEKEKPAGGGQETRRKRSRPVLALGLLGALAVLFLTVVASLAVGSGDVPFRDVVDGVLDPDTSVKGQLIVQEVRIPRTVAGLLAGAALGLAGAVMQGVARNPLADPQLLGINAGASVAVVCSITLFGFTVATQFIWFGFLGALLAALLVYGVGSLGREGATPVKLALAGPRPPQSSPRSPARSCSRTGGATTSSGSGSSGR